MNIIEVTCRQRLAAALERRQIYEDENEKMIVYNMDVSRIYNSLESLNIWPYLIFVDNTFCFF